METNMSEELEAEFTLPQVPSSHADSSQKELVLSLDRNT